MIRGGGGVAVSIKQNINVSAYYLAAQYLYDRVIVSPRRDNRFASSSWPAAGWTDGDS